MQKVTNLQVVCRKGLSMKLGAGPYSGLKGHTPLWVSWLARPTPKYGQICSLVYIRDRVQL